VLKSGWKQGERKMTFQEVCNECFSNDELINEFNRLTGYKLGVPRTPIEEAVDKACGYNPDDEAMPFFIDFIYKRVWLPLNVKDLLSDLSNHV